MRKFEKEMDVRWSDADPNRHVRHSAYYEYGAQVRIRFFIDRGFDSAAMEKYNLGPILFKEECSFIKEIKPDDTITINMLKGKMTEDVSRWVLHHEVFNKNGIKSAHITVTGAWMDLAARKLAVPPPELAKAFHELPEGEHYVYSKSNK